MVSSADNFSVDTNHSLTLMVFLKDFLFKSGDDKKAWKISSLKGQILQLGTKIENEEYLIYREYKNPDNSAYLKLFFLFLNQIISCGYSNELFQWDGSLEHP